MTLATLARQFGVTRLARLTGLDRIGVEVVGAVRPRGHVLQVSQGKGRTIEAAQWSALGEALELAAAENPDSASFRFGPAPRATTWNVDDLSIAWVPGVDLHSKKRAWVPAEAVYCPPAGRVWMGPSITHWKSNGLGAHPTSRVAAVEHAVLELVERDSLARVLPKGWTEFAARQRFIGAVPVAEGFAAFTFDLTPRGASLPVAGSLLFDLEGGVVPLTAGYACRRTWRDAAESAFLEAAQSRLTEIHGAREDVLHGEREAGSALLAAVRRMRPREVPKTVAKGALAKHVRGDVVVVELRAKPYVVKAVSQGLLVSDLL